MKEGQEAEGVMGTCSRVGISTGLASSTGLSNRLKSSTGAVLGGVECGGVPASVGEEALAAGVRWGRVRSGREADWRGYWERVGDEGKGGSGVVGVFTTLAR